MKSLKKKYIQYFKSVATISKYIVRDLYGFRFHDAYTSFTLRFRITALKSYLGRLDVDCKITQHYRSRKQAHKWSTAYHIASGHITLGALRMLKNGKDKDGNIWYESDWDDVRLDNELTKIPKNILENAMNKSRKMNYAEEGYESNSPYRAPNLASIPVSKHVNGKAIDLYVDWPQLGGAWSEEAEKIISKFGLIRPHRQEPWHFELDPNKKRQISLLRKDK